VRSVEEQVVEVDVVEAAALPGFELLLDARADSAHRRARQRRLGPEHLGERRLDVPVRQAPHPGGDHQGLKGVGAGDAAAEQR